MKRFQQEDRVSALAATLGLCLVGAFAPQAFGNTIAWIGFEVQRGNPPLTVVGRSDVDQALPDGHSVGQITVSGPLLARYSEDVALITDGADGPPIENVQSIHLTTGHLVFNGGHTSVAFPFHAEEEVPENMAAHQLEQGFGGLPGDATIEWLQKGSDQTGRLRDGGASILFSNGDRAFNRNRFNVQYNEGGTISGEFITSLQDGQTQVPIGASDTPIPLGQWIHMAIVRKSEGDGEFTFQWYVNGQRDDAKTTENVGGPFPNSTAWMMAGSQQNDDWRGFIDEIRISDEALTPEQMITIEQPSCVAEDDPFGQYQDTVLTSIDAFAPGDCQIDISASGLDDTFDPVTYVYELSGPETQGPIVKTEDFNHTFEVSRSGDFTVRVSARDNDALVDPETGEPCPQSPDATDTIEVTVPGPCQDDGGVGPFLRGDCDGNGTVGGSPTEAIVGLNFSFRGGPAPPCLAACDAEANGSLGITDYLRILRHSFLGQGEPDAPFPDCVTSALASDVELGCETSFCLP